MMTSGSDKKPPHRLTPDDVGIIVLIAQHRCLSGQLIADLLGRDLITTRLPTRLKLLAEHQYLERKELLGLRTEGKRPYSYLLAEKGAHIAAVEQGLERSEIDWKPADNKVNPLFLGHLMATNQVRAWLTMAAEAHGYTLLAWRDDRTMHRDHAGDVVTVTLPNGTTRRTTVIPDSYFAMQTDRGIGHFFLEIDLGHLTAEATSLQKRDWRLKTLAYLEYRHSKLFQFRYGANGFRVITVTTTEARLQTLKAVSERSNGRNQFWYSTFARIEGKDIVADQLFDVAQRPGERRSLVS